MVVSLMYGISFIFACLVLGLIVFLQRRRFDNIFTIITLVIVIVHFGYFSLSMSSNYEEALLAYKITYLDGTIVPYLVLVGIMEVCGLRNNKVVTWLSCLPIVTYALGLTAGYSDIFYSEIEFHRENGYSYLTRSYGPLHIVGTICVIVFMLAPIMPVVYAFIHRNTVSYKYVLICGLFVFVNTMAYFVQSFIGISFEVLPFQYNLIEVFLVILVYKTSRHDIKRQGYILKNHMKEYGFLAFDGANRYLGCDDVAMHYFPELAELKIDTAVDNKQVEEEFLVWENYYIDDESIFKYFKRNNKDIKCRKKPLLSEHIGDQEGFLIEVINDTDNVRHVKELNQINGELREAVEEAKKANESKNIFLSRMSHEIRTPINAIIGMNEIILRDTRDSKIKPYSKTIAFSARMLLMLINDLLDFSKIEAGKMELFEEDYEEKKLLYDAIQMVRQRAISKDLELVLETEGEIPKTLHGDMIKNQQVIINLLTNAIKYTDVGKVTLKVWAEENSGDIVNMHYDVIDTGIGIKKEDIGSLFEAFKRVDLKHNSSIEGTGLGLSITSTFVHMMNGQISVESEFGKGSVFSVVIPQKKISEETMSDIDIDILHFEEDDEKHTKRLLAPDAKVLVVDDNQTNLNVFKFLLNPTKIQIVEASSGFKALEILEKESFDMIFLDHMMPTMDGIQTLQAIKERQLLKSGTAVIALTANAIGSAREMYIERGFTDYLSKPVEIEKLVEMLFTYLPEGKYSLVEATEEQNVAPENNLASEVEKLPELDEFDFEYAVRHMGSAEGVRSIAGEIYRSLPESINRLDSLSANVDIDEVRKNYQIEVHTLKGNTASIGALLLSKTCRLAEVACIEGDVNKIKLLHPVLMEELQKHYKRLEVFGTDAGATNTEAVEKTEVSVEEVKERLQKLKESLSDWDYDAAEAIAVELQAHLLPEVVKNSVEEIIDEVHNLNGAYAVDLIEDLI